MINSRLNLNADKFLTIDRGNFEKNVIMFSIYPYSSLLNHHVVYLQFQYGIYEYILMTTLILNNTFLRFVKHILIFMIYSVFVVFASAKQ